ncbi:hypothetical protein LINPERHAP2_LOCUS8986 [Linum perenne]
MLWRVARDVLPTREALRRRGMMVESVCGVCNNLWESPGHLFITCSYATTCWRTMGLLDDVERILLQADSVADWLFTAIRTLSQVKIQALASGISGIWRERNCRVWGEDTKPASITGRLALDEAREWSVYNSTTNPTPRHTPPICPKWHPPEPGSLTCNVDGAIFRETMQHGAGMLIRRSDGSVVGFRTSVRQGCPEASECEAMALYEALVWLQEMSITNIKIELDSQTVCTAINSAEEDLTEFGDIINRCRRLIDQGMKIVFVRRDRNVAAHVLARQSRHSVSPSIGEAPPSWLVEALNCICLNTSH